MHFLHFTLSVTVALPSKMARLPFDLMFRTKSSSSFSFSTCVTSNNIAASSCFSFLYWLWGENRRAEDIVSLRWVCFAPLWFFTAWLSGWRLVGQPLWSRLTISAATIIQIAVEFGAEISGPEMMKLTDFGDTVSLPRGPSADWHFLAFSEMSQQLLDLLPLNLYRYLWQPEDQSNVFGDPLGFSSRAIRRLTFVEFSKMSRLLLNRLPWNLVHGHVSPRMNCNNSGGSLTFYLAPSSGQNVNLSKQMQN